MRIGLQIPNFTWPGGPGDIRHRLADIARIADEGGFASLWVMDHFFQIRVIGPAEHEMLESYSTLAYLAGLTQRIKLGTLVTGAIYRHPGVLAKTVTTLDVLSGGRAYLGIGAAWNEEEAVGLGIPFPPVAERFERLEETLKIVRQMWSGDDGRYQGRHYTLARTLNSPQPLALPHPPILIGGGGERKTLRLVAEYGDACNLFARLGVGPLRTKLDVLRRHCDQAHRNYDEIEKTVLDTVHLAPGQSKAADVIAHCRSLATIGIQHVIFNMPNVHELAPLGELSREVIPAVAEW